MPGVTAKPMSSPPSVAESPRGERSPSSESRHSRRRRPDARGAEEALFPALTGSELIERIDRGVADADAGDYVDSEAYEQALAAEFGLA